MTIEDIAREQARILGPELLALMDAAAEAQEVFTLDELEAAASTLRKEASDTDGS